MYLFTFVYDFNHIHKCNPFGVAKLKIRYIIQPIYTILVIIVWFSIYISILLMITQQNWPPKPSVK